MAKELEKKNPITILGAGTVDNPFTVLPGEDTEEAARQLSRTEVVRAKLVNGETVFLSLNCNAAVYLTTGKMFSSGIEIGLDVLTERTFKTVDSKEGKKLAIPYIDLISQFEVAEDIHKIFSKAILGKEIK